MPNCNCCEHHLDGMDLQNPLCIDCQSKEIPKINEQARIEIQNNQIDDVSDLIAAATRRSEEYNGGTENHKKEKGLNQY